MSPISHSLSMGFFAGMLVGKPMYYSEHTEGKTSRQACRLVE